MLAPEFVRLTAAVKLLAAFVSVIAAAPAVRAAVPPTASLPDCVIAPVGPALLLNDLAMRLRPTLPVPRLSAPLESAVRSWPMASEAKANAVAWVIATLLAPEFVRLTKPAKLLAESVSVIAAAPAVMTDVPPTVSLPDCVIAPVETALLLNEVATRLRPTLPLPRFRLPLARTVRS